MREMHFRGRSAKSFADLLGFLPKRRRRKVHFGCIFQRVGGLIQMGRLQPQLACLVRDPRFVAQGHNYPSCATPLFLVRKTSGKGPIFRPPVFCGQTDGKWMDGREYRISNDEFPKRIASPTTINWSLSSV